MIALLDLAKHVQDKLNENNLTGLKFNIATETGEFKRTERDKNKITQYVNGVMLETSSEVTTLNNGSILATANCNLRIIVDLEDEEQDEVITFSNGKKQTILGYENQIKNIRERLVSLFQDNEPQPVKDYKGKEYTISSIYQLPTSGIRSMEQVVGDSYTFNVYILFIIIENGINSRHAVYTLDNIVIPYQSKTTTRTPILDGFVFANTKDGTTKHLASMSSFTVTLEIPALSDETTAIIFDNVFNGDINQAHILKVQIKDMSKFYLVTFAEAREMAVTLENMGQNITLVEAPSEYELVHFSDLYKIYEIKANNTQVIFSSNAMYYVFGADIFGEAKKDNVIVLNENDILVTTGDVVRSSTMLQVQ